MKLFIRNSVFVAIIISFLILPSQGLAQTNTIVRVDPLQTVIGQGQSFSVDIVVEDVLDLYAFDVTLHFNPDHIQVESLAMGDFLTSGLGGEEYDNDTGYINFYNSQLMEDPKSGSGTLFIINFTAKNVDATSVLNVDEILTELVEYDTYELILFETGDGFVKIGEGGPEYNLFLPMVLK